jgi:hypothetical protein
VFGKYGEQARAVLEALLDKFADHGVQDIEDAKVLELPPFDQFGSKTQIRRGIFGSVEQYTQEAAYTRSNRHSTTPVPNRNRPEPMSATSRRSGSPIQEKHTMNLSSTIKSIQDIMRKDDGVDGDAQRLGQLTWMLFLKVFDQREEEWEDDKRSLQVPLAGALPLAKLGRLQGTTRARRSLRLPAAS